MIGVPASLGEVLVLAALLVFCVTALSAVITTIFIGREGLLLIGSQFALLFFTTFLARRWLHPLLFATVFESPRALGQAALALCFTCLAFAGDRALHRWLWDGALLRDGRLAVPRLVVRVSQLGLYLLTALTILQFVYGQSITAIATLSGAFAIILGLSAQSTIGEMFAGIAIALSKPFRIGDWVKIGDLEEGQVVDMTWRLVTIQNNGRHTLNVTNRLVADQPIRNYSYPSRVVRISEAIYFDAHLAPLEVQRTLVDALHNLTGVLVDPEPSVMVAGAKNGLTEYRLRYFIDDYAERDAISERVWLSVIAAAQRSQYELTLPRHRVELSAESWTPDRP